MELDARCLHETQPTMYRTDATVGDHKPLTLAEIRELLLFAIANHEDVQLVSKVQVRLGQAIPNMLCPRPIEGPVARRQSRLDEYYVRLIWRWPETAQKLGECTQTLFGIINDSDDDDSESNHA